MLIASNLSPRLEDVCRTSKYFKNKFAGKSRFEIGFEFGIEVEFAFKIVIVAFLLVPKL